MANEMKKVTFEGGHYKLGGVEKAAPSSVQHRSLDVPAGPDSARY